MFIAVYFVKRLPLRFSHATLPFSNFVCPLQLFQSKWP